MLAPSFIAWPCPPLPAPLDVFLNGAAPSPACRAAAGRRAPAAAAAAVPGAPAPGRLPEGDVGLLRLGDVGLPRAAGGEPGAAFMSCHASSSSPQPSVLLCCWAAAAGRAAGAAGRAAAALPAALGLERAGAARLPPMPSLESRCRASSSAQGRVMQQEPIEPGTQQDSIAQPQRRAAIHHMPA